MMSDASGYDEQREPYILVVKKHQALALMLPTSACRVAVIGGGISGLAAALRLTEIAPHCAVTLFEAAPRLGGVIQTVVRDGFLIETSADSFLNAESTPWARQLCERHGLAEQLQPTSPDFRGALVVHRGKLVPVPEGFTLMSTARIWPVLTTPLLSWRGKLRLACEMFVPRRTASDDESLASFVRRRLGRETYERIVQPLVGGIYSADPERLSMRATLRQYVEMEEKHGSLIRASRRQASAQAAPRTGSGARYALFATPRNGLTSLVEALAARLPPGTVRLNAAVSQLAPDGENGWRLVAGDRLEPERFDGVIVAAPAARAAELARGFSAPLAGELAGIPYSSMAVVALAFRREQIGHPLDAFGYVSPLIENRPVLAGSFSSVKFPNRAPEGTVLFRAFVGGACQAELLNREDGELERLAAGELARLLAITGEPLFAHVYRWHEAMPQYLVGHLDRVGRMEELAAAHAGLAFAGNALRGVGIPFCIRSGEQAAEKVYASVSRRSGPLT